MKLDKRALKSIVKECLVEILAEGMIAPERGRSKSKKRALSEAITTKSRSIENYGKQMPERSSQSQQKRPSYLDNIHFGESENTQPNPRHERAVTNVTKSITKDPLMQELLADTAKTTLQEQVSAESSRSSMPTNAKPADAAAAIVSQAEPEELFGESAKNWATLAFS
jgi:hypothetical protein